MKTPVALLAISLTVLGAAQVSAVTQSPFPKPRPGTPPLIAQAVPVFGPPADMPRPKPRPTTRSTSAQPQVVVASAAGLAQSPFPKPRPAQRATPVAQPPSAAPTTVPTVSGKARKICGRNDIRGIEVSSIKGSLSGCGVSNPVQVMQVSGVTLSTPATMDCTTAKALETWIEKGVQPTVGRLGGGVASLRVAAGYSCRTRNSQPGAKISEHGKGRAIDISGITLNNGKTITVLDGWGKGADGKILTKLHQSACGPFKTVLGPDADKYHQDHFHFDTARATRTPYCR